MKQLKHLKELHAKTTEGELRIERRDCEGGDFNFIVYGVEDFAWCLEELDPRAKKNAEFIVESHKMVPRLIKALDQCMEQRDLLSSCCGDKEQTNEFNKELKQILEGKDE